jgi:uncharacterized damage-inducible protein DinB
MGSMERNPFSAALREVKACFDRTTACLGEEDAGFAPAPGAFTVAQHVAHVALTIEWFLDGAFGPGFSTDIAALDRRAREVASLAHARAALDRAVTRGLAILETKGPEEMAAPLPEGPLLSGAPRSAILAAITDHTAHHRGALAVCARLRGKIPALPYA